MKQSKPFTNELRQRNKDGVRGYQVASVAYFGPDDQVATKVVVFILPDETFKPSATERWQSVISDLRDDEGVNEEILHFIDEQGARRCSWTGRLSAARTRKGRENALSARSGRAAVDNSDSPRIAKELSEKYATGKGIDSNTSR